MSEALRHGMSRSQLYGLRDRGVIEMVSRGVYRLTDLPEISDPDLVVVGLRIPNGVVCLVSALSFHGLTTEIPHQVSIAVRRGSRVPSLQHPPVQAHSFGDEAHAAGIEVHRIDGASVRIYCAEKTLADCFKFRNRIGMDVVQEALRSYRVRGRTDFESVMRYAKVCRVDRVMRPYVETIL